MPIIIAVKCPTCGANVSKTDLKCRYCNAELIIISQSNQKNSESQVGKTCQECNMEIENTDLVCPTCGTRAITSFKDAISVFDNINNETAHFKNNLLKNFLKYTPTFRSNDSSFIIGTGELDIDELLYYFLPFNEALNLGELEKDKNTSLFAITSKRLIFVNPKKYPKYLEIPLNSIVSVSPLAKNEKTIALLNSKESYSFNVFTEDKRMIRIDGMRNDARSCVIFWCYLINAVVRQNHQKTKISKAES